MTDPDRTNSDMLQEAVRWSWVVPWQGRRLQEAQRAVVDAQREWQGRQGLRHGAQHRYPHHHRLDAERHFLLIAARDLLRALKAFEGTSPTVPELLADAVVLLRDCLEHFDEPDGRSGRKFRGEHPESEPGAHSWGAGGTQLGGSVDVVELAAVADRIHHELLAIEQRDF